MASESPKNGCGGYAIWFTWLLFNILGTGLGWPLGWWLSFRVPGVWATWVIGGVTGLILGSFQSLVLRQFATGSSRWILATTFGWALGFFAGAQVSAYLGFSEYAFGGTLGAVLGLILGMTQWLYLRSKSAGSIWWIGASIFAWTASLAVYLPGLNIMGVVYGAVSGALTGLVLVALSAGIIKTQLKSADIQ